MTTGGWRDSDYYTFVQLWVRPSGTGSVSLLGLDESDAEAAEARKLPLGFRAPQRAAESVGECSWTARDLL